jgi:uncharacterized protein YajQ (UPF0234 family)
MPSFDVVSELQRHELTNALDQANREVSTRFDFKGTDAKYEIKEDTITLHASADFQLKQMLDIFNGKIAKRGIDVRCFKVGDVQQAGQKARQELTVQEGIDAELGKKIVATLKDSKLKVKASIQDNKVRVTGDKRDDLQAAIALLRKQSFNLPLQFNNFRD